MKKYKIKLIILLIMLTGCGGAKYNYNFDKGKNLNFKEGKWILNEPFLNYKEKDAYTFAKTEFEEILGDSLLEMIKLRQTKLIGNQLPTKLIGNQLPFKPTKIQLKEIKDFSNCDFLINIQSKIIRDEMGNSAHSSNFGSVTKYNEATAKILIYDLNRLELISEATSFGVVKETKTPEDKGFFETFDYTTPGRILALNTIKKLIKKYHKYQKD